MTFRPAGVDGSIARSKWPQDMGYLRSTDTDEEARRIPTSWDSMCEVFKVEPRAAYAGDPTRRMGLFWNDEVAQEKLVLRVWGFVKEVAMSPTGNWDGYVLPFI